MFSVIIIRIIRGKTLINMPSSAKEKVKDGDILHMLGTKDDIEACMMLLEKEDSIEYTDRDDIVLKRLYIRADLLWRIRGKAAYMLPYKSRFGI